ncbi:hypothetical protein GALMADRAFT_234397 [Galerina marginata CBS 339.88]|uniref:Uncharacterized protein n=1 Tax=Galerina marginata (strain CBS 339.88) TaxID=685588 RepID=A0A067TQN0_GALM3|nr:hypothetical protein GALMADRAFT_234397 [Galerina marginata CBS 339.88]
MESYCKVATGSPMVSDGCFRASNNKGHHSTSPSSRATSSPPVQTSTPTSIADPATNTSTKPSSPSSSTATSVASSATLHR